MPTPPRPDEQKQQIINLYQQGASAPLISKQCGCFASTVYNILRDAGLLRRKRGVVKKLSNDQELELVKSAKAGIPRLRLAESFGISRALVFEILKRHGATASNKVSQDLSTAGGTPTVEDASVIEYVDDDGESDQWIRGKWMFDGAKTIDEMIQCLHKGIKSLEGYKKQGYELRGEVHDDYARLCLPRG